MESGDLEGDTLSWFLALLIFLRQEPNIWIRLLVAFL